ncbi:MAG: Do family serine endopeptidase [Steroidobacteraceae bacterium]
MKSPIRTSVAALALATLVAAAPAIAQTPATAAAPMPSLAPMVKRVSPAVVNIATSGVVQGGPSNPLFDDPFFRRFFDLPPGAGRPQRKFQSAGSGVIIDAAKGYIITNAHVVENATEITVNLQDGRELAGEVVGADPPSDIALLKVPAEKLAEIRLGDSDQLEVGDYVVAIGNPFGLKNTVTSGIVSALGRNGIAGSTSNSLEDFIQTDASINPGNSGGALVNLRGELIGINSAILSRSGGNIGIGFAIPVNMARAVIDQLKRFGAVKRGLLGVSIAPVTPDIAKALGLKQASGALITELVAGSAAESAGLKPGDVITSVNGKPVRSDSELRNTIGLLPVGAKLDIGVIRDGQPRRIAATVAENNVSGPPEDATAQVPGDDAAPLHPGLAGAVLGDAEGGGVLVRSVARGSRAAAAGLRSGDVIAEINNQAVPDLARLRKLAAGQRTLLVLLKRGRALVVVPVR